MDIYNIVLLGFSSLLAIVFEEYLHKGISVWVDFESDCRVDFSSFSCEKEIIFVNFFDLYFWENYALIWFLNIMHFYSHSLVIITSPFL